MGGTELDGASGRRGLGVRGYRVARVTHCLGDLRVFHEFEGKHTAGEEHYSSERLSRSIDLNRS